MPEIIGEVIAENSNSVVFRDRGEDVVTGLGDIAMVGEGTSHYTDSREGYEANLVDVSEWLKSHELRVQNPDGSEEALLAFEEILPFCQQVDAEYAATVTPRLFKNTDNPEHRVPRLDPDMVYASYVSLRAGGAVVLPTSVGNIVGSASPRGLSTMFAVKERPLAKAGVVLTTMDQIPELADIPEGWEGYLRHMHSEGILTGSKLPRNNDHRLFVNQPEWSRDNSMFNDGTSMFVFLPGPYSDVTARILASEDRLLTASSANKSGEGNNRDLEKLHKDIKRGCDFVAWDPLAVSAYPLDEENESQGVMVDFQPKEDGTGRFHIIRFGFMNGPFMTESVSYLRDHPELKVPAITADMHNVSDQSNK